MFTKSKIRTRLAVAVLVPALALVALAAVGYRTLYSSKIGSRSYDRIIAAHELLTDVAPPTQYVIDSYAIALSLVGQTDLSKQDAGIARLDSLEASFTTAHTRWDAEIRDGSELDKALNVKAYDAGKAFFEGVDGQLLPAVRAGDTVTARTVMDAVLTPAFEQHRAAIEQVLPLAQAQVTDVESFATQLVDDRTLQLLVALGIVGVLIVVVSVLVARSIINPVRQLTGAAERAEAAMPELVARVHQGQSTEGLTVPTVSVASKDELASLAHAMNQMQATAVQLATEQAQTRRNVSVMLANLARRNQGLLNRTLSFISQLEENERDPETLQNLFKLDHLATRMRRNAESLLVLAGAESPRTWPRPIEAAEIVRAALSEIESYDRVDLTQVDPVWVRGSVVSDLIHLLAELLDNATRFSPPETKVAVVGKLTDKGYVLSVIDQGMGMSAEDLAAANREFETLGRPEERSTMVLGLAVVGRLAHRSGVQVRLSESPFEGVTAQVRVPFDLIQTQATEPTRTANGLPTRQPGAATAPHGMPIPSTPVAAEPDPVAAASAAVAAATSAHRPVPPTPGAAPIAAPVAAPPPPPPAPVAPPAPRPMAAPSAAPMAAPTAAPSPAPMAAPPQAPMAAPTGPVPTPFAPPIETTAGGLLKRVPGANLFEAGPPADVPPPPPVERTAASIRDALSSFQYGFQRGPATETVRRDEEDA